MARAPKTSKLLGLLEPHPVREAEPPADAKPTKRKKRAPVIRVRRIHRRDLNAAWEFLKLSFRDVNRATVEYQRPRTKQRFLETYEEEGVEQLLFTADRVIVAYAECTFEILGKDTWVNPAYFPSVATCARSMWRSWRCTPNGAGAAWGRSCSSSSSTWRGFAASTHLVLEVAENNENALGWYRKRGFRKLDAAIFLAQSVSTEEELLPPRELQPARGDAPEPSERSKIVVLDDGDDDD